MLLYCQDVVQPLLCTALPTTRNPIHTFVLFVFRHSHEDIVMCLYDWIIECSDVHLKMIWDIAIMIFLHLTGSEDYLKQAILPKWVGFIS